MKEGTMRKSRSQTESQMGSGGAAGFGLSLIGAAAAGAALMYFLDPGWGRRRRVLARDKLNRIKHKTSDAVGATSRDLKNRAYGIMAETRSLVSRKQVSDEVLAERVRARLGSLVSRASSIQVWCENGRVLLSGDIAAAELARLLRGVAAIRGVSEVENHLSVHEGWEPIPDVDDRALRRPGRQALEFLQTPWPKATRLLMAAAGGVLALSGVARKSFNGGAVALLGMVMMARALSNSASLQLAGGSEPRAPETGVPPRPGTRNGEGAAE